MENNLPKLALRIVTTKLIEDTPGSGTGRFTTSTVILVLVDITGTLVESLDQLYVNASDNIFEPLMNAISHGRNMGIPFENMTVVAQPIIDAEGPGLEFSLALSRDVDTVNKARASATAVGLDWWGLREWKGAGVGT